MTTEKTQTTTNVGGSPQSEAGSAETDLDKLLKEFDSPSETSKPEATVSLKAISPVIKFVNEEMIAKQNERLSKDISDAVSFVKEGDVAKEISTKLVRGYLEGYAAENDSFKNAFLNRNGNTDEWKRQLGEAKKAFLEEIKSLPSSQNMVQSDIEAARASVSGRVSQPGEPKPLDPNALMSLSDQEFEKVKSNWLASKE